MIFVLIFLGAAALAFLAWEWDRPYYIDDSDDDITPNLIHFRRKA